MDKEKTMAKVEQLKILAEDFLQKDIKVFITDINDEWYFADILLVGEELLAIQCFGPKAKEDKNYSLRWASIVKFKEYEE